MTFATLALDAFRNASAAASATALVAGDLDLLDSGGAVIATVDLGTPVAAAGVMTASGFPKTVAAIAEGSIASARFRTSAGGNWKTGLTVGIAGSGAQVIVSPSLAVELGQSVRVNGVTLTHTAA